MSTQGWRSSVLNRVLKLLGVSPREAMVAIAMAGRGERTVTAGITSIPGIDLASLSEIVPRLEKPPGGKAEVRSIGGKDVSWWTTDEFVKASWAADGLVMTVAGRDIGLVESAIAKLP